jgi:hypothetical protein
MLEYFLGHTMSINILKYFPGLTMCMVEILQWATFIQNWGLLPYFHFFCEALLIKECLIKECLGKITLCQPSSSSSSLLCWLPSSSDDLLIVISPPRCSSSPRVLLLRCGPHSYRGVRQSCAAERDFLRTTHRQISICWMAKWQCVDYNTTIATMTNLVKVYINE